MPHIVVEYSQDHHSDERISDLLVGLHHAAASTGIVKAEDLKVRAAPFALYLLAGRREGFCHVSIFLLAGRTDEQRVTLAEALRGELVARFPGTPSLSVDVREMDPVAYKKRLRSS